MMFRALLIAVAFTLVGCGTFLKNSIGQTSQGVHVIPRGELRHPVSLDDIDLVYEMMLTHYTEKWGTSREQLDYYMSDERFAVRFWSVELFDDLLSCETADGRRTQCAGLASTPSFMWVTWRELQPDPEILGAIQDVSTPFCLARTALAHELYHLLLYWDQGDTDAFHTNCWGTVVAANQDAVRSLCPWLLINRDARELFPEEIPPWLTGQSDP